MSNVENYFNWINFSYSTMDQGDIQKRHQTPVCKEEFGRRFLETQFSKPLLRVSQFETQDLSIKRILLNLREIQDGVQSAGRTLMRIDRHISEQYEKEAVTEALYLLKEAANQISSDLFPLIRRLSQRKNHNPS